MNFAKKIQLAPLILHLIDKTNTRIALQCRASASIPSIISKIKQLKLTFELDLFFQ